MVDVADWQKLAGALRELHRTLLEHARRDYERTHLVNLGPGELLQLLTTNAEFAWLRGLSELMVDIDLVRDAAPLHRDEVTRAVRAAVEHLLSKSSEPVGPFAQHYWPCVQNDPLVAMAHAGLKQAVDGWPRPQPDDQASLLHERHLLAEKARHLSRRN